MFRTFTIACRNPNPAGCPNHGRLVRDLLEAAKRAGGFGVKLLGLADCPDDEGWEIVLGTFELQTIARVDDDYDTPF
jgi:hypothetical protein